MEKEDLGSASGKVLFGLVIAALGVFFVFVLLGGAAKAKKTRGWDETPCFITRSDVVEERPTPNSPMAYRAVVEYEYRYGGKRYVGENVKSRDAPTSHRKRAEAVVEKYPVGRELSCWVDPDEPGAAVLKHDTMAPLYTVWFPGLFVVAGIGIAVSALRGARS